MATERFQICKCQVCGIIAEVLEGGAGEMVCCGQQMAVLAEKTADEGKEKHVPVVEVKDDAIAVKVGSVPHPMEEKHFIQWIEVVADGVAYRQFLQPGQAPEAVFQIKAQEVTVREHCNIHGLWKA